MVERVIQKAIFLHNLFLISPQKKEKNIKQIKNCYGFVLLNAAQFHFPIALLLIVWPFFC
jgi:hypothetical protein